MSKKQFLNSIWQFTWSKWAIYLTVFLAPLYVSMSHWFPFTTPKTLLITGGTLLAMTFFVWGLVENREESIKVTILHYVLFIFLFIMSVAGFFGIDPHTSFFGTFLSSVGIVFLIMLGFLSCLVAEFTRRDFNFVRNLLVTGFSSGVLVSFIAYWPLLGASWKILELSKIGGSTIGNSSFAGAFLLFALGFGIYLFFTTEGWSRKLFISLGILSILLCPTFFNSAILDGTVSLSSAIHSPLLLIGDAEGAALGVAISIIIICSLWLAISKKKIAGMIGTTLFILFVIGITYGYFGLINPNSRIHQAFVEEKTATRFLFWYISRRAIAERPLLGWGFENFQTVYQQHFDPIVFTKDHDYIDEQSVSNPHNVVYDMAVSSGILGLITYLVLLGFTCFVFIDFARKNDGERRRVIVLAGVLLCYLIQNFFIFDTPTAYLMYFLCIGIAMGCLATMKDGRDISIPIEDMFQRRILGSVKSIVLLTLFILFVILPMYESWQWQNLRTATLSEQTKMIKSVPHISLMGGINDDARYANEVLNKIDEARRQPNALTQSQTILDVISSTLSLIDQDNKDHPGNFYANYEAGMLAHLAFIIDPSHNNVFLDQAKNYLEEAHKISPLNPRVYFNLAQNELFRQNPKEAIALIRAGMALGAKEQGQAFLDRLQK